MTGADHCFKLIVIGDSGTGKSCLLRRFLEKKFPEDQTHTIAVEFGSKTIKMGEKTVKLQIWDTAGQERYKSVTRSYYRGASGAILVYDITNYESFKKISQWLEDAKTLGGKDIVCFLVGNKVDNEPAREVQFLEVSEFAQQHELMCIEASAVTGENVDAIFTKATKLVLAKLEKQSGEAAMTTGGEGAGKGISEQSSLILGSQQPAPRASTKCNC